MTGIPASCRAVSAAILLALLVAAGLAAAPAADEGEFYEAAVRHLEKAVKPQRSGEHLERLRGLRQMRETAASEASDPQRVHVATRVGVNTPGILPDVARPKGLRTR